MDFFTKVDYFKKVSAKHKRATLCGGVLSVISVVVIVLLLFSQVMYYWVNPRVFKKAEISNEYQSSGFVQMNLDITFENAPCLLITVFIEQTQTTFHFMGDQFSKQRVSSLTNKPITPGYVDPEVQRKLPRVQRDWLEIITGIVNKEQCRITGNPEIQNVPGMLLFSYRGLEVPLMILSQQVGLDLSGLNYKHKIQSLSFGEMKKADRRFKDEGAPFDRASEIELPPNSGQMDYEYYLVVVPHIYKKKESDRRPKLGYKYSLNYNMRKPEQQQATYLRIEYAFSPITMVNTLEGNSFWEFLIHLCAIIGGSFVILGIVNRTLISAFTSKYESAS